MTDHNSPVTHISVIHISTRLSRMQRGVYQSHYCASESVFCFTFVCVMYLFCVMYFVCVVCAFANTAFAVGGKVGIP